MPRRERNSRARLFLAASDLASSGRSAPARRAELIRAKCGLPLRRYSSSAATAARPSGTIRSLSPLPRTCTRPSVELEVAGREPRHLRDAQPTPVQQFQNGAVAQRRRLRLGMRCRHAGPLQHLRHLGLGQRLGQHLPRLGRFNVHRGIAMETPVHQQPFIKTAQAAQLPRYRARVDFVVAQMPEKRGYVVLPRGQQYAFAPLEKLGENPQIAQVGLACQGSQPLLHAQIGLILLEKLEIAGAVHSPDYPRPRQAPETPRPATEPASSRNQLNHLGARDSSSLYQVNPCKIGPIRRK